MSGETVILGGRYRLGRILGTGGMAEVFLAEDTRLHRTVAVKVSRSDLARDANFQERFRREAHSAASLNHPSIVAVYDTGEERRDHAHRLRGDDPVHRDGVRRGSHPARVHRPRAPDGRRPGRGDHGRGRSARWSTPTAPGSCTATSSPATS
ncbi:hypothetical protein [Brachybacterium sp. GPGPB12]|uniref:protein kinase domain-containing protein n=1 Tax=Brachybacterium sp. GPGPB12 TaxID=3023517 RepID=UPI0031342F9D